MSRNEDVVSQCFSSRLRHLELWDRQYALVDKVGDIAVSQGLDVSSVLASGSVEVS